MSSTYIEHYQTLAREKRFYNGPISGIVGPQTDATSNRILGNDARRFGTAWSRSIAASQVLLIQEEFDDIGVRVTGNLDNITRDAMDSWIKYSRENAQVPTPPNTPQSGNKKVAIVIGHNSRARGAVRTTDGVPEFVWNRQLADEIVDLARAEGRGGDVRIFLREAGLTYTREIDGVYAQVHRWGADSAYEFHFNAATPAATGIEMLYAQGNQKAHASAQAIQNATLRALGLRDRGLKPLTRGARGARSVWAGNQHCTVVLTEWYFGSNRNDCQTADRQFKTLAREVWNTIK